MTDRISYASPYSTIPCHAKLANSASFPLFRPLRCFFDVFFCGIPPFVRQNLSRLPQIASSSPAYLPGPRTVRAHTTQSLAHVALTACCLSPLPLQAAARL